MQRRFPKSSRTVLQFLMASALLGLSCGCLWGQSVDLPHGGQSVGFGIQIITPTNGVDFANFAKHLVAAVKVKWIAKMPQSALMGDKGRVVVRFSIQKDGTLTSQPPIVEETSKNRELDSATVEAVRSAAPFDHLPDAFDGPSVELRLTFLYNLPPDQGARP
jgi:TonB family protein